MIRNEKDIESVTITDLTLYGTASIGRTHFKKALFKNSVIVFYRYDNRYFYPISLEFRLIDNNLLFLFFELGVKDTELMKRILTSSMNKEEKWSNDFKIAIIELDKRPRFCYELDPDFSIPRTDYIIYESELPESATQ